MRERMRLAADVLDDLDLPFLDDVHLRAEVALAEDDVPGGVVLRRVLDGVLPSGRLEDGFHLWQILMDDGPRVASRSACAFACSVEPAPRSA
jgi:hypothetical protein